MAAVRRWLPVAVPASLGVFLVMTSRAPWAGIPLIAVAAVSAVLILSGIDVGARIQAGVDALAGAGFAVAVGLVFAVGVIPGWLLARCRRSGLQHRSNGWMQRSPAATAVVNRRPARGLLRQLATVLVLVLVANYVLGWGVDLATGRRGPDSLSDLAGRSTYQVGRDPRVDSPAMANDAWRFRYFADLQRTGGTYWPFTEQRPTDFSSPYLHIRNWQRRTWRAPDLTADAPNLWMFGGSTTFGEGQRDDATIASWLARLAAADGLPVRIDNYGQRGWTHFQEMILYEQQLAQRPDPDLAVFYDGVNELSAQSQLTEAVPAGTSTAQMAERVGSAGTKTEFVQQQQGSSDLAGDAWFAYSEHSLVHKVAHLVRPTAASAAEGPPDKIGPPPERDRLGTVYDITDQDGIDAAAVYRRGQTLSLDLSADHGVEPFFFWQPVAYDGRPQQLARARLRPPTVNVSDALDNRPDVYIDGAHTNETGARLVAEALWLRIEPAVRRWYREHG